MLTSIARRPLHIRAGWIAVVLAIGAAACSSPTETPSAGPAHHLLIVVDGLRPDYVTPETMPTLTAMARRGVVFSNHHSVYPTVTRVNASSISTGAYPETHGLLGNTVFFPKVDPSKFLDTSVRDNLLAVQQAEGQLLTTRTMAEALEASGRKMLVVSSGSSGSAFLNNHTVAGGAVLHYEYALPPELGEAMKALGPAPTGDTSPASLDSYAVDAFLHVGLPMLDPSVTTMWLSGLDTVAHEKGIGDAATVAILKHVDNEIARIEAGLEAAGVFDKYDIWVTSDHGFSTHTGAADLASILNPFNTALPDGSPRIVANGGAIYVRDNDSATIASIVEKLQQTRGIGAIFTAAAVTGAMDGAVPGTLSFDAIRWSHRRSAQILYSSDWTDAENSYGTPGAVSSGGTAGHGSASPWDVHNTLIVAGPGIRQGTTITAPSANVDFAPTFLSLLNVGVPESMQGRVLTEALAARPQLTADALKVTSHTVTSADGRYSATAAFSTLQADGKIYRYFDNARVNRR